MLVIQQVTKSLKDLIVVFDPLHKESEPMILKISFASTSVEVSGGLLYETVQSDHICGKDIKIFIISHTLIA